MAIKPILFNTEMVRAILDERKSCTRRLVKPQPKSKLCYTFAGSDSGTWGYPNRTAHEIWGEEFKLPNDITEKELSKRWNPPYQTDDILYVRETCGISNMKDESKMSYIVYRASEEQENEGCREVHLPDKKFEKMYESMAESEQEWHPSIHMPKEAARIWLKVTDVRVERLQEITEVQAQAEGCNSGLLTGACTARGQFEDLWNTTIKKSDLDRYGWDANPWVWVIEFERC